MNYPAHKLPDYNTISDKEFRKIVKCFLEEAYPNQAPRFLQRRARLNEAMPWYMVLSDKGWLAPTWPREWGGMELSPNKHLIFIDEFENFGAARVHDIGVVMLGPLLMKYGTEKQKLNYLPKILEGTDIWAQGYSEPNAGSDLASLRTEAVREGENWIINGQKTWTTLGADANWIFILVRTDKTVKKQAGISFILVPMSSEGITVRPIENLELKDELCEVFFDNVKVPVENLVGKENDGWSIAKALLGHERVFIGAPRLSAQALGRLKRLAIHTGVWEEESFRNKYIHFSMDLEDLSDLFETYTEKLRTGAPIGADVAVIKIFQSELYQRISDEMIEISAEDSGRREPASGSESMHASGAWLAARPTTIFGGSNEVMRNMLAKFVLKLPT